ncbi:steroid 5-alpha reductase [Emticicia aquatilis]|uniref:Steroid 5-alpha reductase n=2 Tax=Emticicia aquatilis TaxID=1537369 RepID=A0A917DLV0_9BACT|nr:steroid 5-alpha reductase [Emticicia aquatilis]
MVKDASIIDIFWGTGFVIVAWFYRTNLNLTDTRSLIYCILISIWGLRLSIHLAFRNIGKGEDYRYQEWRKQYQLNWWWVSFLRVFLLQGVLLWIISAVYVRAIAKTSSTLNIADYVGILLWLIGFTFEAIGDWQLTQFKKNPANKGKVLQTGFWALTRHPNYFGDALLWWGFYLFAFSNGGFLYIFSPVLMTFLLMKVSGVTLLEQKLQETKPQYADYIKRVPAFFPKFF